ncbi:hypothetical protein C7S20_02485 [Christiangramia fulva]|uniref:Conjugal transfer protein TraN n=1 Tax=Christiangramia fulva TaxID=2126553 RepID=A0A2R3Z1T8_9FLAO|nr:DUF4138 domain-containing protein [Christiangramia fulva]AVR44218.1 hypothetical protein C7S20_02485 [Christiangramia fulva]
MKNLLLSMTFFWIQISIAQHPPVLYCNSRQNVAVVLPSPISSAISGSEDFVFSYNQQASDTLGLLQGRQGRASNLFIRTADGGFHSFILKFRDSLPTFTYYIRSDQKAMEEKKTSDRPDRSVVSTKKSLSDSLNTILAQHLMEAKERSSLGVARKGHIKFEVKAIAYIGNSVYIRYKISNRSAIDFEINQVGLRILQGSKQRKSSYQEIPIDPIFTYQLPDLIPAGHSKGFVIVYPKFTVTKQQQLEIMVNEKNGSRYLSMSLRSNKINKPYRH